LSHCSELKGTREMSRNTRHETKQDPGSEEVQWQRQLTRCELGWWVCSDVVEWSDVDCILDMRISLFLGEAH
jgi:hypothetical protein